MLASPSPCCVADMLATISKRLLLPWNGQPTTMSPILAARKVTKTFTNAKQQHRCSVVDDLADIREGELFACSALRRGKSP